MQLRLMYFETKIFGLNHDTIKPIILHDVNDRSISFFCALQFDHDYFQTHGYLHLFIVKRLVHVIEYRNVKLF